MNPSSTPPPVARRFPLLPPTLLLTLLCATALLYGAWPGPTLFPGPARILALPVVLLGVVMSVQASRQFRKRSTNIKTFNDPGQLVTDGWFRWSRNPMYLGFALVLLGVALAAGGVTTLLPTVVFVAISEWVYIPYEESAMERVFGEPYRSYRSRVRRWF